MILIETGYHEINAKGNPDLGPHSVFTSAVKGLDAEVHSPILVVALLSALLSFVQGCAETDSRTATDDLGQQSAREAHEKAELGDWQVSFFDSCTGDWQKQWFLDGEVGKVTSASNGMELTAGPEFKNDAHHMVLWTKELFKGDLKIEYDYTRLDSETNCVNILYIQATGSGEEPYVKDITEWSELRRVPAMRMYFDHMNTYHISYAAFPNDEDTTQYIRARRYMPNATGLAGSDLEPDYYPEGLFQTGVLYKITVIKKDREIFMRIQNPEQDYYCHMTNPDLPTVTEGRVGLRHMFTRSSRYKNIRISVPK